MENVVGFPKNIRINKHIIKLEEDKESFFGLI